MECICDWIFNNANVLIAALNAQSTQNQVCDQSGCFQSDLSMFGITNPSTGTSTSTPTGAQSMNTGLLIMGFMFLYFVLSSVVSSKKSALQEKPQKNGHHHNNFNGNDGDGDFAAF